MAENSALWSPLKQQLETKEEKMKRWKEETLVSLAALAILVLFFSLATWVMSTYGHSNAKGLWWNEYTATMDGYVVCIDESQNVGENTPRRIVHLREMANSLAGITGHDYNMDGVWDRVFFNGYPYPTNGCNSYLRIKSGWRWEPCEYDKDMTPIPESEIPRAIALLDSSMTNRTIGNLTTLWTYRSTTDLHRSRE